MLKLFAVSVLSADATDSPTLCFSMSHLVLRTEPVSWKVSSHDIDSYYCFTCLHTLCLTSGFIKDYYKLSICLGSYHTSSVQISILSLIALYIYFLSFYLFIYSPCIDSSVLLSLLVIYYFVYYCTVTLGVLKGVFQIKFIIIIIIPVTMEACRC